MNEGWQHSSPDRGWGWRRSYSSWQWLIMRRANCQAPRGRNRSFSDSLGNLLVSNYYGGLARSCVAAKTTTFIWLRIIEYIVRYPNYVSSFAPPSRVLYHDRRPFQSRSTTLRSEFRPKSCSPFRLKSESNALVPQAFFYLDVIDLLIANVISCITYTDVRPLLPTRIQAMQTTMSWIGITEIYIAPG
jgi:hypothetical protein